MNKSKIINMVAIIVAIAVVAGTSAIFITRYRDNEEENVTKETVTSFQIIGNADSENAEIQSQLVTNKDSENSTQAVTDKHNEITTSNKYEKPVVKPSYTITPNEETTIKITAQTPVTNDTATQQAGAFGFVWDASSGVFYSSSDPWQRQFGYNRYYDTLGGYVALWYDTVRIKFNYGGYDWLVQFWKGQYGFLLLGAEAGVYFKEEGNETSQYVCNDDSKRLKIGYTCYNKGEELFVRPYQDTWWLTGFVPGKLDKYADRSQLKMKIRITLKDKEMRDAFIEALKSPECGFVEGNAITADTFYKSGNDVYLMWQTDRSKTS